MLQYQDFSGQTVKKTIRKQLTERGFKRFKKREFLKNILFPSRFTADF